MKKLILFLFSILFSFQNIKISFAKEINDEMYYKRQIQYQRCTYNIAGLCNSINKKNSEAVELFMKAGFNPNSSYMGTPMIMYALFRNDIESFKILLKYGANPETTVPPMFVSVKSQNLLSYAIKKKNSEAVKILIKYKVDVNKEFNSRKPLNYALQTKQPKIVDYLLTAGAKPDEKTIKLVNKSKDEYLKSLFNK